MAIKPRCLGPRDREGNLGTPDMKIGPYYSAIRPSSIPRPGHPFCPGAEDRSDVLAPEDMDGTANDNNAPGLMTSPQGTVSRYIPECNG